MAMSPQRREKIATEKRKLIQDAALALFDKKGYSATTISDIAELAGISKGLVYKYFESKKDIVLSFGNSIAQCGMDLEAQPTPKDALRLAAQRVLLSYEESGYHAPMRVLITCYVQGDVSSEDISTTYPFDNYGRMQYGPLFRRGQEMGLFHAGDPEEMGDFYWHMIMGYAVHMIHANGVRITSDRIEDMLALFCLD